MAGKILFVTIISFFSLRLAVAQGSFWSPSNGPYGGYIHDIKASSVGNLFVSTECRLFKSTTGGATWQRLGSDSMSLEGLAEVCIDSSGYIFVGHQYGIVRSSDDGQTWEDLGTIPVGVRGLVCDEGGRLFAGTWRAGFFRSDNLGQTWQRCSAETLTGACFWVDNERGVILAGSERGIYRSTDIGSTWNFIDLGNAYITDFMLGPSGTLYATSSTSTGGLFKSTDNGSTWILFNSTPKYCQTLLRTNAGRMLGGSAWGLYVSDDSGSTWILSSALKEPINILFSDDHGILIAGTSGGGLYSSTTNGSTWLATNTGLSASNISSIVTDKQGFIYAGSHKTVFRSTDRGSTFAASFKSMSAEITTVASDSAGNVYTIVMDTIFVSTNHGMSWGVACATGIWQPPWTLTSDPDNNLFTVTRSSAVYRSTDHGHHWSNVFAGGAFESYLNIAFTPDGTGFFTGGDKIYRSTDHGLTWGRIAQGLQTNGTMSFCIDKEGTILLGTNGSGILRSTDKGETWTEANGGLPSTDRWIRFIICSGTDLLVYTWSYYYLPGDCVYRSTDSGQFWFREASGMPNDFVTAMAADQYGGFYVGTQSNGMYYHQLLTPVAFQEDMKDFQLSQNYPNPWNPSTTIRYALPHTSFVTITVYNTLGQQVAQIVNEQQQTGYHDVLFRGDGLASGVYFYRIQAGEFVSTKRLLLLK